MDENDGCTKDVICLFFCFRIACLAKCSNVAGEFHESLCPLRALPHPTEPRFEIFQEGGQLSSPESSLLVLVGHLTSLAFRVFKVLDRVALFKVNPPNLALLQFQRDAKEARQGKIQG